MDLASIRQRLANTHGDQYWTCLEELAGTKEFEKLLHQEFPAHASEWADPVSRRHFLKLMGASLALAGVTACTRQPQEKIVPYVKQPESVVPGNALFFATAMPLSGYGLGLLVESHEGRPTKIEGNPEHPASLGATSVFEQAAILGLYDPDRSQAIMRGNRISSWEAFLTTLGPALQAQKNKQGATFRLLTGTVTSPTLTAQIQALLQRFPKAKWYQYEPISRDSVYEGSRLAFGTVVEPRFFFDKAQVIVSLDADFLLSHPARVRYAREFTNGRRVRSQVPPQGQATPPTMNRLYVVESSPTITGSMADHRLPLASTLVETFARVLARNLQSQDQTTAIPPVFPVAWMQTLLRDLKDSKGKSIILAGEQQPPIVHALAHWMNHELGNHNNTVAYLPPVPANPGIQLQSLRQLVAEMQNGAVELLVILESNPVFTTPADLSFGQALSRVKLCVHHGLYHDETAAQCHWHIPATHFLETWSDLRAFDGTVSIVQPLIEPLFNGRSAHVLAETLLEGPLTSSYEIVRRYWANHTQALDSWWNRALHDGIVKGTELRPQQVQLQYQLETSPLPPVTPAPDTLELTFRPDPTLWDGRFANNAWLQEMHKPITKLTWDNPALISPSLAERMQLNNGDVVELRHRGRLLRAAIWITPGQADHSVTLYLGQGRSRVGQVGKGQGFNAYALRTTNALWFSPGLEIRKTGKQYPLATTQTHHRLHGRALARDGTLSHFLAQPDFVQHLSEPPDAQHIFYNLTARENSTYRWAMAIDLNTCIGCNTCTMACQAENNIPVVGKSGVLMSREMHWIRVDTYFKGALDNPTMIHQPVPCMHCETAPCEYVCPVAATSHSNEGLNEMTYNRCIGTRYCSNNCPYKVRRFNFFNYGQQFDKPSLSLMLNPDVTVRTRGVMEKCTYCVQRINAARIEAKKEGRRIQEGEVIPACAQACPTEAIIFGDLNNPESQVAQLRASPLNYGMLAELNTRPRTTYLAKLTNPNPNLTPPNEPGAHSLPSKQEED
ncbi:MAG TPA: TAT-variant-translocated molybdopterin oxidoreductase [Clostridia bacterium]|nr:TAT-variant-translocated molybdopterin oxidoreductase [Clostridia bacterium]